MTHTPWNYLEPVWESPDRVHDWRNYISDEVRSAWLTFTPEIRAMLARQAEDIAENEEWE